MDSHTYRIFHCRVPGSWFAIRNRQADCGNSSHSSTPHDWSLVATSSQSLTKCGQEWEASFFGYCDDVMNSGRLSGFQSSPPPLSAKLMGYEIWKATFASSYSALKSGSDQKQDQIEIHVAFYLLPTLDMKSWLIRNWIWLLFSGRVSHSVGGSGGLMEVAYISCTSWM